MKRLPAEMRDWYFPFDWDVRRLWALDVPVERRPAAELEWHFDIPIRSRAKGMWFDLRPREVLENPGLHVRHDERIHQADVTYAIDMMFTVDRVAILDGVPRSEGSVARQSRFPLVACPRRRKVFGSGPSPQSCLELQQIVSRNILVHL